MLGPGKPNRQIRFIKHQLVQKDHKQAIKSGHKSTGSAVLTRLLTDQNDQVLHV